MRINMNTVLKCIIHVLGLLSLLIVLSSRNIDGLGKAMVSFAGVKGPADLYRMTGIGYFREYKQYNLPRNDINLEDADVIVFADSFGNITEDDGSFHMRLQKLTNVPVFWKSHAIGIGSETYNNPLHWLEETAPTNLRARVLVWLMVERSINGERLNCKTLLEPHSALDRDDISDETQWRNSKAGIREQLFDNSKIEYVVKNCFPTRWVFEAVASARFFLFWKTSTLVPQYSLSPKMLFFLRDIDSFNQPVKAKNLDHLLPFFVKLRDMLMEKYRMHLIFVPVPTKYTIYHDYAASDSIYNDFLPLLVQKLEEKEVPCVNLYPTFIQKRSDILYYSDDTHWNGKGIEIAAALTSAKIREKNLLDGLLPDT